ncbi:AAA family ATPase [Yeosuana sp.]|uniref:AAA family ATPase n=1 Tax=Yeosuana sp. TaxID=2529388 RepID=UPI004054D33C
MLPKDFNIHSLQTKSFDLSETASRVNISQVFSNRSCNFNEFNMFMLHFNAIPNYITEQGINCTKANDWFLENYSKDVHDVYYNKNYFGNNKTAEYEDVFYFLHDDLVVNFDDNQGMVRFLFRRTDISKVETVIKGIKKFKSKKSNSSLISLLVQNRNGIDITNLKITKPKLRIEDNYNDDFKKIHHTILKRLRKKNDKGLVLLYGKPGTGKTSYIRYLITSVRKDVIFLPPNMANSITSPHLISILIDNPNSIFVIEDAENIVVDRERDGNSPVSALLNISDGLLSDCLNIQIICSFNTDVSKIDTALLRKGRLIAKYDFKELEVAKANKLSEELGFNTRFIKPAALALIYNQEEQDFQQLRYRTPIGFKSESAN